MTALTPRQAAILDAIRTSIRDRDRAPTLRELAPAVGLRSVSSVARQVRILARAGHLRVVGEGQYRRLALPDATPCGCDCHSSEAAS
jgi:repressor LexA